MLRYAIRALCLVVFFVIVGAIAVPAAVQILEASFRPDQLLPEFDGFWKNNYAWGDAYPARTVGGGLRVFVKNTGTGSITISDLLINGESVAYGIQGGEKDYRCGFLARSVRYGPDNTTLINAGEPVWWRADPSTVAGGGTSEMYVRMRTRVATTLSLAVVSNLGNTSTSVVITNNEIPKVAGYALSSNSTILYLYLRHPVKGSVPTTIKVDDVDLTASCTMSGDSKVDIVPVKCILGSAFARGSYHTFQAIYSDGSKATDGLRVFADNFKFGVWGGGVDRAGKTWWQNLVEHSVNYIKGGAPASLAEMNAVGFTCVNESTGNAAQYGIALCDEIDAGEGNVSVADHPNQSGTLAQSQSIAVQDLKRNWSAFPTILNLDATFKPYNYYNYGHVADILSVDPYYIERICDAYWNGTPNLRAFYQKATYVNAVSATCQAACEPHPLHVILCVTRRQYKDDAGVMRIFRYSTPEEERITAYYAVGSGAKQLDHWWTTAFSINQEGHAGLSDLDEPGKVALWRELGLVGAEFGVVGDLIVNSAPTDMPTTKSGKLWTRTLMSGLNTIVLLCVNDDYACDNTGTIMQGIDNAEVSLDLPSWLTPAGVFEVDYKGIRDVPNDRTGSKIDLHLGKVNMTRMIIVTSDSALKTALQAKYTTTYGPRVTAIMP